jgi:hypothetical protein
MARKTKPKRRRKKQLRPARRAGVRPRKPAASRKPQRARKRFRSTPLIEIAVREMNQGRSLSAAARSVRLPSTELKRVLKKLGLLKRKRKRWIFNDDRPRRIQVVTEGRTRNVLVRGYEQAGFLGEYHHAVREFLRTNNLRFLKPFKDRTVQAMNGREYFLETDPNALYRIAAMDSPQFHEIYEITSNT